MNVGDAERRGSMGGRTLKLVALILLVVSQGFVAWSIHQRHVALDRAIHLVEKVAR